MGEVEAEGVVQIIKSASQIGGQADNQFVRITSHAWVLAHILGNYRNKRSLQSKIGYK